MVIKRISVMWYIVLCAIVHVGPNDLSIAQEQVEPSTFEDKQKAEDALVKKLMEQGVEKDRFRLPDVLPKGTVAERMTVQGKEVESPWGIMYQKQPITFYPKDEERYSINTLASGYEFWPTGNGSVWCIIGVYRPSGYLAVRGYMFEGEESDPLTFLLMDKIGLVYLHGKGKVIMKNGKEVKLGY